MKALVLSGGSVKGAFQAGAIEFVLASGFVPDLVYGISVGSLNGAFLVDRAGRAGRPSGPAVDWPAIGTELTAFWRRRVTRPEDLIEKRSPRSVTWNILRSKFDGLVGIGPLTRLIHSEIDAANLRAAPTRLMVGAVNLADGSIRYADPAFPRIVDYVVASAAMPLVMPVVDVMGQPLCDGGLRDIAPLGRAIDEGADQLVCIVCQADRVLPKDFNRRNLFHLIGRVMDVVTNEIVENDLRMVEYVNQLVSVHRADVRRSLLKPYRHVRTTLIRPKDPIPYEIDAFTKAAIAEMIALGRYAAEQAWKT